MILNGCKIFSSSMMRLFSQEETPGRTFPWSGKRSSALKKNKLSFLSPYKESFGFTAANALELKASSLCQDAPGQDALIPLALVQQRTEASYMCRESQSLLQAGVEYIPMFSFHIAEWEQTLSKNITSLVVLHISEKSEHCGKAAWKGARGCHPFDSWIK